MKRLTILALCAGLTLGCTGCVGKPVGGALTEQGMEAIDHNEYEAALADFEKAIDSGEAAVPALRGKGMALMAMANYDEAVKTFDEALEEADTKMPDTVKDIRLYKASAQFRMKDYEGTSVTCDELLETDEKLTEAHFLRGASFLYLGYTDRAREDFNQAVVLSPGDYTLYLNIYECYEAQKLSAVGDEYLQIALNIEPQNSQDYYCIGEIYYYLEQYEEARNALLTPVDQKYLPAMELMGQIFLAQGDYAHAKAMYESIQQDNGVSVVTCNGLAMCALESGEYDEALSYIGQGLQLEDESGRQELCFNEIVAYERKLDFSTAKAKAEAYVAMYPTDEAGRKELKFLATR